MKDKESEENKVKISVDYFLEKMQMDDGSYDDYIEIVDKKEDAQMLDEKYFFNNS